MGNTTNRFFISLFSLFGAIIVFINYAIWSDTGITINNSGTEYYFGFRSLLLMFEDMQDIFIVPIDKLSEGTRLGLNMMGMGLPEWIQTLNDYREGIIGNGVLVTQLLLFAFQLLLAPVTTALGLLLIVASLLSFVVAVLVAFFGAIWGQYNLEVPPNPYETSEVLQTINNWIITL